MHDKGSCTIYVASGAHVSDRVLLAKFPHRSDQWDVMAWEAPDASWAANPLMMSASLMRIA